MVVRALSFRLLSLLPFLLLVAAQEGPHIDTSECQITGFANAGALNCNITIGVTDFFGQYQHWQSLCTIHARKVHILVFSELLGLAAHVHIEDFLTPDRYDRWSTFPFRFPAHGKHGFFFDWALDEGDGCERALAKHMSTHMSNSVIPPIPAESAIQMVPPMDADGTMRAAQTGPQGCGPWTPRGSDPASMTHECHVMGFNTLAVKDLVPLVSVSAGTAGSFKIKITKLSPGNLVARECSVFRVEVFDGVTGNARLDLMPFLGAAAHVGIIGDRMSSFTHAHGFDGNSMRDMQTHMPNMPAVPDCNSVLHLSMMMPKDRFGPDFLFHATFANAGFHLITGQFALGNNTEVFFFFQVDVAPATAAAVTPSGSTPSATPSATATPSASMPSMSMGPTAVPEKDKGRALAAQRISSVIFTALGILMLVFSAMLYWISSKRISSRGHRNISGLSAVGADDDEELELEAIAMHPDPDTLPLSGTMRDNPYHAEERSRLRADTGSGGGAADHDAPPLVMSADPVGPTSGELADEIMDMESDPDSHTFANTTRSPQV